MSASPKPSYHHGNLHEGLLDEAIALIRERGAPALTLRAVAKRLGVTHAAPYRHFRDKRALLLAIAERGFRALLVCQKAATRDLGRPIERLEALAHAYVDFSKAEPALFRLMFGAETADRSDSSPLEAAVEETFDLIQDAIVACQVDGSFRAGDPRELGLILWSVAHGLATLVVEGQLPPGVDPDISGLVRRSLRTLYSGLSA